MQFANLEVQMPATVDDVTVTIDPGIYVTDYSTSPHNHEPREGHMIPGSKTVEHTSEDRARFFSDAKKLYATTIPQNILWRIVLYRNPICHAIINQEWMTVDQFD
jgi:hypothetical protein